MEILSLLVIVAVLAILTTATVIGLGTMWSALDRKFHANQALPHDLAEATGQ